MRHGQEQGWGSAEFEGGKEGKVHLQTDLPTCLTCATSLARTNVATVLVLRTYLPTRSSRCLACLSACLLPASFLRRITTNITNIPLSLPPSTQ